MIVSGGAHCCEHENVNDVIIHEGVVIFRKDSEPHEKQKNSSRSRRDAHPDAENECETDKEKAYHEEPVDPHLSREGLKETREGACGVTQKSSRWGSTREPCFFWRGGKAKTEKFVEKCPEKNPAETKT